MIDKRMLEKVLSEQKDEIRVLSQKPFCKRQEESRINLKSNLAQVVIGVRRSGKSTLCFNVLKKAKVLFAYINFDDERLIALNGDDLNNALEVLYKIYGDFKYLFIDEIQNIPEWFLFVNRLLRQGMHIVITGSIAKLLSGELATHLTGRHSQIELFPFSFSEYCAVKNVDATSFTTKAIAFRRAAFDEYLKRGGFPELLYEKDERAYISGLVENILSQDIQKRYSIRYSGVFKKLANHLLNNAPTVIVNNELQNLFRLKSLHTAENYVGYLKQAYLLVGLQKYSTKSKLRIRDEKVYPVDVALMSNRKNAFVGDNFGWRLETAVYIELLRRCKNEADIYYYAETSCEADFVICQGNKALQIIQVSYSIMNEKTKKREIRGLLQASKSTGCKELLIITDHEYENIVNEDIVIRVVPAYEWMLE